MRPEKPHGTTGRYRKGCRCEQCVTTMRAQWQASRDKRRKGPIPAELHGTWNCYTNYGCKCEFCLEACRAQYANDAIRREANRDLLNEKRRNYYHNVVKPREAAAEAEFAARRNKR